MTIEAFKTLATSPGELLAGRLRADRRIHVVVITPNKRKSLAAVPPDRLREVVTLWCHARGVEVPEVLPW